MRDIQSIIKEVAEIYRESGNEAEEYLREARRLKEKLGPGLAVVYCWFYSVPQKWTQVEPKIFELMKHTNSFDLATILSMPQRAIASILKPMIFYNEISLQLQNFCRAIKNEYSSWNHLAEALTRECILSLFEKLRKHRNIRLTFKNLSAMKILVGMDDDLLILDTHVAKVIGLKENEMNKYRIRVPFFLSLLELSKRITNELGRKFNEITTTKWSLAIWFYRTRIRAEELLKF